MPFWVRVHRRPNQKPEPDFRLSLDEEQESGSQPSSSEIAPNSESLLIDPELSPCGHPTPSLPPQVLDLKRKIWLLCLSLGYSCKRTKSYKIFVNGWRNSCLPFLAGYETARSQSLFMTLTTWRLSWEDRMKEKVASAWSGPSPLDTCFRVVKF